MKQLIQNFNSGELRVEEVPPPTLRTGGVLVRNMASAVSAGTERTLVQFAQKGLLGKARARPDLLRLVLNKARRDGVMDAMRGALRRLDKPMALGYSSAGIVVAVGEGVDGLQPGDRVACAGGNYATHGEIVFVPRNLVVKMPDNAAFEEAAYVALGSVAMHGVRLADVHLGETAAVIGLGLLGQLTIQMLRAAGCTVLAIDLDPEKTRLARELGADETAVSGSDDIDAIANHLTSGKGVDATIITAATPSSDPVKLAGEICRERGKVIVVGDVGLHVPRRSYYAKELDLKVSRSYGPGRYDPVYEEKGYDYPVGYVRWTEGRNMANFLSLIAEGRINVGRLITHRFGIEDAVKAYELVTGKVNEKFLGVVITYPGIETQPEKIPLALKTSRVQRDQVNIGVIGAGNFATTVMLPILKAQDGVRLVGIATASGITATHVGKKYGFEYCTSDAQQLLEDDHVDTVFILTRHNLHAPLAAAALRKGKNVFVEKPLALSRSQLGEVIDAWREGGDHLLVGFNRRFAPAVIEAKKFLQKKRGPFPYQLSGQCRPPGGWTLAPRCY